MWRNLWPGSGLSGLCGASLDKVAAEANDIDFGLAASIWTRDISIAHKLAKKVKAGSVWINQHNFYDPALPFGGYKQSGWGREEGSEAFCTFTEV
ncbi:aldehyde dehydrogenase family protein [Roseobacter sp. TSBP12]|uniref:aldehyde dehydrogenase family protein n=1 Tax=Roseobacter sp. TSBP12 TaxID=1236613 RepID=UPI00336ABEE8